MDYGAMDFFFRGCYCTCDVNDLTMLQKQLVINLGVES